MNPSCRLATALLSLAACCANAASLKQAEFTRVINDVRTLAAQQQPVPAKIGDKISGQTAVSTGVSSRAELRFQDKTLTRIGSNSVFKLDQADRTVNLEQGVILLQVPKQIGGAKVRTAAVTAAVTGTTVIVERTPDGYIKIIVLEGEVDVYLNSDPSQMRTLVAGDILIFKDDANQIPLPAKVDLELLKKTSKLMDPKEFGPLGNQKHLANALTEQDKLKNKGELLKTAFEIVGRGTQITLTNEARQEIFKTLVLQNRDNGNTGGGSTGGGNSNGNSGGNSGFGNPNGGGNSGSGNTGSGSTAGGGSSSSGGTQDTGTSTVSSESSTYMPSAPIHNAGTTVFGSGSTIVTNPHATAFNSISGGIVTMEGTVYNPATDGLFNSYMYGAAQTFAEADTFLSNRGSWFVFKGDELYIAGDIAVNTTPGPRNVLLGAVGNVNLSHYLATSTYPSVASGTSWTIPTSVDALFLSSQSGSIMQDSSFGLYGSSVQDVAYYAFGPTSDVSLYGPGFGIEYGGDNGIYLPDGSFKAHAGRNILLDGFSISAPETKLNASQDVTIQNKSSIAAKTLIQIEALSNLRITSSSQLVALSERDVLSVLLKAVAGNIELDSAYIDATNVEMVSGTGGVSIVNNSNILADVIKARVMSTGGELLVSNSILGRGTPSATSLIMLYGEGANGVRFVGDNTLNANSAIIAGQTVTIEYGGKVRLSNPAGTQIFTDSRNFNDGNVSYGNFTDLDGNSRDDVKTTNTKSYGHPDKPVY